MDLISLNRDCLKMKDTNALLKLHHTLKWSLIASDFIAPELNETREPLLNIRGHLFSLTILQE